MPLIRRGIGWLRANVRPYLIQLGILDASGSPVASGGTVQGTDGNVRNIRASVEGVPVGDARGEDSADFQLLRLASSQVASGNRSVLFGNQNTASGVDSGVMGGSLSVASGARCGIVGGSGNTVGLGPESFIGGGNGNQLNANRGAILGGTGNEIPAVGVDDPHNSCILAGTQARANIYGGVYHAPGRFAITGDVQRGMHLLAADTSGATTKELFTTNQSLVGRLIVDPDDFFACKITVVARRSDGDFAVWNEIRCEGNRIGSGNIILTGGVSTLAPSGNTLGSGSTWALDIDGEITNQNIRIRFTGSVGADVRVIAYVDILKLNYTP